MSTTPRSAPGLQPAPLPSPIPARSASAGRGTKPGTAGPGHPSPLLFRGSGGTHGEPTRGAGISRRPRDPQGRPRGAVRGTPALPRSSAARSPHRLCASCVPTEQLPRPGWGLGGFNVSAAAALHPVSDYSPLTPPCSRPRGGSATGPARPARDPRPPGTLAAPPRRSTGAAVPGLYRPERLGEERGAEAGSPPRDTPRPARPREGDAPAGLQPPLRRPRRWPRGKAAAGPGKEVSAGPGRLPARPLRLVGCRRQNPPSFLCRSSRDKGKGNNPCATSVLALAGHYK